MKNYMQMLLNHPIDLYSQFLKKNGYDLTEGQNFVLAQATQSLRTKTIIVTFKPETRLITAVRWRDKPEDSYQTISISKLSNIAQSFIH